jgi:SAM-dependent methyltransferase
VNSRRHEAAVTANFDREAAGWARNYRSGGGMAPRLDRFAAAVQRAAPPPARVLDFGCGSGELGRSLTARGWRVTGVDVSGAMLDAARRAAPEIEWVRLSGSGPLPFATGCFDAVVASSVLEYIANPAATVRELGRILVPGGLLLATVPDLRHPIRRRESALRRLARFDPVWWLLGGSRWGNYLGYLRLSINRFPLEDWRALIDGAGFIVVTPSDCEDPLALVEARRR